jgi:hypothetical protein
VNLHLAVLRRRWCSLFSPRRETNGHHIKTVDGRFRIHADVFRSGHGVLIEEDDGERQHERRNDGGSIVFEAVK